MTNTQANISLGVIREYDILCKIQLPYYKNKSIPSKVSSYQIYKKMKESKMKESITKENITKESENYTQKPISPKTKQTTQKKGGNTEYSTMVFFG